MNKRIVPMEVRTTVSPLVSAPMTRAESVPARGEAVSKGIGLLMLVGVLVGFVVGEVGAVAPGGVGAGEAVGAADADGGVVAVAPLSAAVSKAGAWACDCCSDAVVCAAA